jgi:GntR family transcriptional repressor for pyruvate dehydrogenase complex
MTAMKNAINFGTIERNGLSDRVADRILTLITERQLKSGDRLPPERELAVTMGVSRPIIREALRALSVMNVIENRQRAGTFITSLKPEMLVEHLEFVFSLDDSTYLELIKARKIVEPGLAELAAENIGEEDLRRLTELDAKSAELVNDAEAFLEADLEMHSIITSAANNMLLKSFMASIVKISIHSRRRTNAFSDVRQHTIDDHHRIIHAVKSRDPAAARQAMLDHLSTIEKRLMEAAEAERQGKLLGDGHQDGGQPAEDNGQT